MIAKHKRLIFRFLFGTLLFAVLLAAGYAIWYVNQSADPRSTALETMALQNVTERDNVIVFLPAEPVQETGIIFYQGGLVEAEAYAPLLYQLAQAGYPVFVPQMPFNLAVIRPNLAQQVIDANPQINKWAIGGHSLGGGMASLYAKNNPGSVDALFYYGFYPGDEVNLADVTLPVLALYGTNDDLATPAEVLGATAYHAQNTEFVPIEGGNHAQFGDYGEQDGDGVATISAETQWQQTTNATIKFLQSIP